MSHEYDDGTVAADRERDRATISRLEQECELHRLGEAACADRLGNRIKALEADLRCCREVNADKREQVKEHMAERERLNDLLTTTYSRQCAAENERDAALALLSPVRRAVEQPSQRQRHRENPRGLRALEHHWPTNRKRNRSNRGIGMSDDPYFDRVLERHRRHVCHRCGRQFSSAIGLGLHLSHLRKAFGHLRAERICPDLRDAEERRAADMQKIRLKTKLGLLGRHP